MNQANSTVSSAALFRLLTDANFTGSLTPSIDGFAIVQGTRHGEFVDPVGCWDIQTAKPVIHRFMDQDVTMPSSGEIVDVPLKTLAGTTVKLNITKTVPATAQDLVIAQVQMGNGNA